MVQVDYPAKTSYFLNEDAIIRTYKFWAALKCCFTRPCYNYPVVYTDGLISQVVSDGQERTPWGIALGDYIVALDAPKEEMSIQDARRYCENIVFARRKAVIPHLEIMRYILKDAGKISKMLETLGGTPLQYSDYLTSTNESTRIFSPISVDFSRGRCAMHTHYSKEDKVCFRPAIDISNLYL